MANGNIIQDEGEVFILKDYWQHKAIGGAKDTY